MEVPIATSLNDIYPDDAIPVEKKRWEKLLSQFKEKYGTQAEFVARSPGRVNIIGEVLIKHNRVSIKLTTRSTSTIRSTKCYRWL
jgi:hypothetical protein